LKTYFRVGNILIMLDGLMWRGRKDEIYARIDPQKTNHERWFKLSLGPGWKEYDLSSSFTFAKAFLWRLAAVLAQ